MIQAKIFDTTNWERLEKELNHFMREQVRKLISAQYSTYNNKEGQIRFTAMIIYD